MLRGVEIPDVLPSEVTQHLGDFSFAAGDFLELYAAPGQAQQWDAVVTCFFIDTARNVIEYLELIYKCLRPNGVWINCGKSRTLRDPAMITDTTSTQDLPCGITNTIPIARVWN